MCILTGRCFSEPVLGGASGIFGIKGGAKGRAISFLGANTEFLISVARPESKI